MGNKGEEESKKVPVFSLENYLYIIENEWFISPLISP